MFPCIRHTSDKSLLMLGGCPFGVHSPQTGSVGDGALAAAENLVNGTVREQDHTRVAVRPGLDIHADLVGLTAWASPLCFATAQ